MHVVRCCILGKGGGWRVRACLDGMQFILEGFLAFGELLGRESGLRGGPVLGVGRSSHRVNHVSLSPLSSLSLSLSHTHTQLPSVYLLPLPLPLPLSLPFCRRGYFARLPFACCLPGEQARGGQEAYV